METKSQCETLEPTDFQTAEFQTLHEQRCLQ